MSGLGQFGFGMSRDGLDASREQGSTIRDVHGMSHGQSRFKPAILDDYQAVICLQWRNFTFRSPPQDLKNGPPIFPSRLYGLKIWLFGPLFCLPSPPAAAGPAYIICYASAFLNIIVGYYRWILAGRDVGAKAPPVAEICLKPFLGTRPDDECMSS